MGTILEHIVQSANLGNTALMKGDNLNMLIVKCCKALFEKIEFYKSEHLLRGSKLVIDNADVHAWYGWAILHNPDRSEESVKEDALMLYLWPLAPTRITRTHFYFWLNIIVVLSSLSKHSIRH